MSLHGLLGRSLAHSVSPAIHEQLWGCADYRLLPMEPEAACAFLLKKEYDWLNVTIPYKTLALELCDEIHPHAAAIGAVNTVLNQNGVLVGYNTDFAGLRTALAAAGISLAGKKVLVLGSGGTSRTAQAVAAAEGAAQVVVISRTGPDNYANPEKHADAQVIINTTPVGMYPHGDEMPLSLAHFPALTGVFDAVYNPLATPLVQAARARGIPAGGGLAMLVEQGRAAAELFSGRKIPAEKGLQCLRTLEKQMQNIVLTGMPGCGKTTVGRLLAQKLGRPFADLDAVIEAKAGRSIPEIFAADGEEAFRTRETAAAKELGAQHGLVIACGGGTPLRAENRTALAGNGRVYYLQAQPDRLSGEGRPLSATPQAIRALWQARRPVYESFADVTVAETDPETEAAAIVKEFNA